MIIALSSGDHHYGIAALLNSLARSGFTGHFHHKFVGELPPWCSQEALSKTGWPVGMFHLFAEAIESEIHLAREKPKILLAAFSDARVEKVFYFDTDIFVTAPWSFFEEWSDDGLAAVSHDMTFGKHHYHRKQWASLARKHAINDVRDISAYVNSGFVAVRRKDQRVLQVWRDLLAEVGEMGVSLKSFQSLPTRNAWKLTDQACLNAALMATDVELSLLDARAMDFAPNGDVMSHAAGKRKPWHRGFIRCAMRGLPPQITTHRWCRLLESPIEVYSQSQLRLIRIELKIADAIGRIYRHPMSSYYPP